jgi:coenzyme F420-0:L-glutamate ligase / coenzyme F420-1:gamma-L-glutamate ligase
MSELRVTPVTGLPEFVEGMRVGEEIAARAELGVGDVVVVSQKVVSKAEGMVRRLADVEPSEKAVELGKRLGKEPEIVELILSESKEILRGDRVLITETKHGFVCANAGIDASNLPDDGTVCLLPSDPDDSARTIRKQLMTAIQPAHIAVVIADSFGRAWRLGQTEVAIGCAGMAPLDDWRGREDSSGRRLEATLIAVADEAAAAADLVRDKASRVPVAIVRGLGRHVTTEDGPGAAALRRPQDEDLFR